MLLKDILELPVFKSATLVTCTEMGLENRIESVMVLEGTDIDYWGVESELLLTSYFALIDLDEVQLKNFFHQLAQVDIAGLVVKVDRLIEEIPELIVNLCNNYEIPLLQIPESTRYKDIMLAINEPLLNKQNHVLKSYYDASKTYNKLPIGETTFEEIIENLSQLINIPVKFTMPGRNIDLYIGDLDLSKRFLKVSEERLDTQFTQNNYTVTTLLDKEKDQYIYSINSTVKNQVVSNFTIQLYYKTIEESEYAADLMVVENTVHLIRQKLQMTYLLKQEKFMLKNNLSSTILQSTTRPSYEYQVLLDEANISSRSHYKLIGFKNDKGGTRTYTSQKLSYFRALGIPHIYYEHQDYFIIIYNILPDEEKLTKSYFNNYLPENMDNNMVITSEGTKEEINKMFIECLDLLNFKNKFNLPGIVELEELGVFRYLADMGMDEMRRIIPPKLLELHKNDEELFHTMVELFNHNMNYTHTASALFVHPKTVRYRMDKLEKLLNVDFKDSMQFTNYYIYVSIIKLHER